MALSAAAARRSSQFDARPQRKSSPLRGDPANGLGSPRTGREWQQGGNPAHTMGPESSKAPRSRITAQRAVAALRDTQPDSLTNLRNRRSQVRILSGALRKPRSRGVSRYLVPSARPRRPCRTFYPLYTGSPPWADSSAGPELGGTERPLYLLRSLDRRFETDTARRCSRPATRTKNMEQMQASA
jgi:hypothetical protein